MNQTVIDIETWPMPEEVLEKFFPIQEPYEDPGEFDPSTVKVGNLKDPEKIQAKIDQFRAVWEEDRLKGEAIHDLDHLDACQAVRDGACLDPRMSRIFGVAIKTGKEGGMVLLKENPTEEQERDLIKSMWGRFSTSNTIIGWNIIGFDLPFLVARTLLLGMELPADIQSMPRFSGQFLLVEGLKVKIIDLQQEFAKIQIGRGGNYCSLNAAAQYFDLAGKIDLDEKLPWQVAEEDRALCHEYTRQDGDLTWDIAEKLWIVKPPELSVPDINLV